jgi:hypothetical protein
MPWPPYNLHSFSKVFSEILVMKITTGGALLRKELQDISYLEAHPEACELFKEVGCYRFLPKSPRVSSGITEAFSKSFDGFKFNLVLW